MIRVMKPSPLMTLEKFSDKCGLDVLVKARDIGTDRRWTADFSGSRDLYVRRNRLRVAPMGVGKTAKEAVESLISELNSNMYVFIKDEMEEAVPLLSTDISGIESLKEKETQKSPSLYRV